MVAAILVKVTGAADKVTVAAAAAAAAAGVRPRQEQQQISAASALWKSVSKSSEAPPLVWLPLAPFVGPRQGVCAGLPLTPSLPSLL